MKEWLRNQYFRLLSICRYSAMLLFSIFPLSDTVVFSSYRGQYCNDNPLCIYQEFLKRKLSYKYVWLMKDPKTSIEGALVVKEGSIAALFYLATSRVWIDNCRKKWGIRKRKGQYYVQTWHADMALKKVEKDAIQSLRPYYVHGAINDSKMANVFVSSSRWTSNNYKNSFWYSGRILESGSPRSDVFFSPVAPIRHKVLRHYALDEDTKIILYAPTFRGDGDTSCYDIDYNHLLKGITNRDNWVIIIRLHPNIVSHDGNIHYSGNVLNGSNYPSINELIIASDILITDYSSCMFDGMAAKKKVILYASDVDKYLADRGFYFRLDEMPFPLTRTTDELIDVVNNLKEEDYFACVDLFQNELGYVNDGHGAERVVNDIMSHIL